ncbi:MAG: metal ABC transporter substrate-binding protein [Deltaproteobacteria bacterium]|nr:metal ABC transporter substrate-binding protein [Deltaproteobacteria bacterium]
MKTFIKRVGRRVAWVALMMGAGVFSAAGQTPDSGMAVAASIMPLADFARQVGGERVTVTVLVPPGAEPHSFSLRPGQMKTLQRAGVLVLNGLGLEPWGERVAAAAGNPRLKIVRAGEGLPGGPSGGHDAHGGHPHDESLESDPDHNPHVWMDPLLAIEMAAKIRDGFIQADPAGREVYQHNWAGFKSRLEKIHRTYQQVLGPGGWEMGGRLMVSFHAGVVHLAKRYGLRNLTVLEGGSEKEPSPTRLADVIREIRDKGVKVVFHEPQFSRKAVDILAEESGTKVVVLDTLGRDEPNSYSVMMGANLYNLASALGH